MKSQLTTITLALVSLMTSPAAGISTALALGDIQPYVAYIAREGEHARCGPAKKFYKTDPLRVGQEVEVYLETADDWLGIRPPDNSFCWVQSDQIEVGEDDVTGRVINQTAQSWIGTNLGKAEKYLWQVRLDVGEEVTIIGTAKRDGPDGDEFWYQIVPPPGEFRWVHRSQIVTSLDEVDAVRETVPGQRNTEIAAVSRRQRPAVDKEDADVENEPIDNRLTEHSVLDDAPVGSGVAASGRPTPPVSVRGGRGDAEDRSSIMTVSHQSTIEPISPKLSGYQAPDGLGSASVERLRSELSEAMAAGASANEIEPIRTRCATLAGSAAGGVDRGRASLLLAEIEAFQRIAARRGAALDRLPSSGVPSSRIAAGEGSANAAIAKVSATGTEAVSGQETQFDRRGWLVKVYSARPNAPPYAITDSADRTISYVTPVAGINLTRYLNQEIGLFGRVAYDTSLETPHLIAEQVIRLRR